MTTSKAIRADQPTEDRSVSILSTDALFRLHSDWLHRFIVRRFGPEQADDLVQDTFARCMGLADEVRRPRALLATLARRAAADRYRTTFRTGAVEARESEDTYFPDQLERVLLQQLLRELPPKVREVYLLVRVVGLTYAEAAERCGISVKRVEARMTEAHKRFAVLMRD